MAARRLHELVYVTVALCCCAIAACGFALGTDHWFKSEAIAVTDNNLHIKVSYGLFKGKGVRYGPGSEQALDLKVVCKASDNKCMYSCGTTSDLRKQDLNQLIQNGTALQNICSAQTKSLVSKAGEFKAGDAQPIFLSFALYILTIIFISIAIAFSALGAGLALFNTYRTPIQPILSVLGLYVWNGISAACVILAIITWIIAFATSLKKNAAVSETLELRGAYDSNGKGSLGYSFWILILACLFSVTNIGILKYRSWKIVQMEAKNVRVMNTKLDSGDILLF